MTKTEKEIKRLKQAEIDRKKAENRQHQAEFVKRQKASGMVLFKKWITLEELKQIKKLLKIMNEQNKQKQ